MAMFDSDDAMFLDNAADPIKRREAILRLTTLRAMNFWVGLLMLVVVIALTFLGSGRMSSLAPLFAFFAAHRLAIYYKHDSDIKTLKLAERMAQPA